MRQLQKSMLKKVSGTLETPLGCSENFLSESSRHLFQQRRCQSHRSLRGFTLLEMLVVLAVIVVLISILLPAVQRARESVNRTRCQNNLVQFGVALQHYNQTHGVLPPGCVNETGPILADGGEGHRAGWIAQILPFMDQEIIWHRINFMNPQRSLMSPEENAALDEALDLWNKVQSGELTKDEAIERQREAYRVASEKKGGSVGTGNWHDITKDKPRPSELAGRMTRSNFLPQLFCPSLSSPKAPISMYAGIHNSTEQPIDVDGDGLLYLNSSESLESVPDGASNTLLVGEHLNIPPGTAWVFGDRGTLRNMGEIGTYVRFMNYDPVTGRMQDTRNMSVEERTKFESEQQRRVGTFGSAHDLHVYFLLADGSVRGIRKTVSQDVLHKLASRKDGQNVSATEF